MNCTTTLRKSKRAVILIALTLTVTAEAAASTGPARHYRVLHVMSHHSPWEWTDTQLAGFKDALKGVNVEYRVVQLDAKNASDEAALLRKAAQARALIDGWKPDLVYTSDDEAQQYVGRHYVNTRIPFVFSGVNRAPETYGYAGSTNTTGVLEIEHFLASARLLRQVAPKVRTVAVVLDDAPMWPPVVARMQAQLDKLPELKFVRWDTIKTFNEYQQKMREYQGSVDAVALIGIFNFKDEKGQNVHYRDVLKWTAEHSRLPDFSFWKDRVTYGTLGTVSVSGYQQGLAAGKIARAILIDGKSPQQIPMEATTKGEAMISLARARRLGLNVNSGTLLSTRVVTSFPWEK